MMKKRLIAAVGAALSITLAASACSGSSSSKSGHAGGSLTVGVTSTLTKLTPQPTGAATTFWARSVYEPLVSLNGGSVTPVLAASTQLSADGKSMTIKLRPNVTYSDGTKFDADAVLWNINWMKQPATGAGTAKEWENVTAAAVDPLTVKLTFARPMPQIYGVMDLTVMVKPNAPDKGIGTGPFMVSNLKPGTSLSLKANPNYWNKSAGLPTLKTLTFKIYPDASTAAVALQSGAIRVAFNAPLQQVATLESAGFKQFEVPTTGNLDIMVNTSAAPLDNPKVRQALSLAFDRETFVNTVLKKQSYPAYTIWPKASSAYAKDNDKGSFDLQKAKSLLQQAGVSGLTLTIDAPSALLTASFLPVYVQDLAKVGVTLKIHELDLASWVQESSTGSFKQLLAGVYGGGSGDPGLLFSSGQFRPTGNAEHYVNPQYQQMVEAAASDLDAGDRLAKYRRLDQFVQQRAFLIPLAPLPVPVMYSNKVSGVKAFSDGFMDFNSVKVSS